MVRMAKLLAAVALLALMELDAAAQPDEFVCRDSRGIEVTYIEQPSESEMVNAQAALERDCDQDGRCRDVPVVYYNPNHPYLEDSVMRTFTLLHECGHHVHGDPLRQYSPSEPLSTFVQREARADCWAATTARSRGMLACADPRSVVETLEDAGRVTETQRARLLSACISRLGCR